MKILNETILKALSRQAVDKTPVWLMRQAGRYLPEYRKIRQEVNGFMQLCQTPSLAAEVTLQPLRRYDLDAAILFSDILTIPDAMGLGLYFTEGEGPKFQRPIKTLAEVQALEIPEPTETLAYVLDTISLLKPQLSVPLLGFSGSPWTLATYMIEGGTSKTFSKIKAMLYQQPETLRLLLEKLALSVSRYLIAQIKAGCNAVMIFDTWGGILTTDAYLHDSLHYMEAIVKAIKKVYPAVPVTLFTKNGSQWLESIARTGCDCISVDWTISMSEARKRVGSKVALQGNLDPAVLYAKPEIIKSEVKKVIDAFGEFPGHVFNLGHGMQPDFNPDHVSVLVDAVHEYSKR